MPKRGDLRETTDPVNSLVASAQNHTQINSPDAPKAKREEWQQQAWFFYDVVGEFEYVANWVGNMLSRARLYPAKDGKEITSGPAFEAVAELFGSDQGKADALRTMGINYTVPGESYIFAYTAEGEEEREWLVASPQSVTSRMKNKTKVWIVEGDEIPEKDLLVFRTFQKHPRFLKQATSPARAALPSLNEIYRLTQHIDAQISSRLASAGILLLPNEMTFKSSSSKEGDNIQNDSKADDFVKELTQVMSTSINNRADPSALVPIVVTADGEYLDKPRLLQFWSELDAKANEMRSEAVRRLGLALDVPPEILTGTGDVSHWQAWGVDEASVKAHTEPLLNRICHDLTKGFLRHAIKGEDGVDDVSEYSIMADTADMRLRPNRSKEAFELFDRGQLTVAALLRETGFDPKDDAPQDAEAKTWLLRKIASGSATPEMVASAAEQLGITLIVDPPVTGPDATEAPPTPSLEDHPDTAPTPTVEEKKALEKDAERKQQKAALVAAGEQMVFRALERGGNRINNKLKLKNSDVAAPETYMFRQSSDAEASFMLEGAFEYTNRFADQFGVTAESLAANLEEYCRELIVRREPHTTARLSKYMDKMEEVNA